MTTLDDLMATGIPHTPHRARQATALIVMVIAAIGLTTAGITAVTHSDIPAHLRPRPTTHSHHIGPPRTHQHPPAPPTPAA
jgi:hypothetical protein